MADLQNPDPSGSWSKHKEEDPPSLGNNMSCCPYVEKVADILGDNLFNITGSGRLVPLWCLPPRSERA